MVTAFIGFDFYIKTNKKSVDVFMTYCFVLQKWNGGFLFAVPPQNTSRTCPCCGYIAKENRQTQAVFKCLECGYTENADVVGAINILRRGQAIQAA